MIRYLNLSQGFNPFGAKDGECIPFEHFRFSGGEPHIKVDKFWNTSELFNLGKRQLSYDTTVAISVRLNTGNDLLLLAMAVDALRNMGVHRLWAFIPYFPGARQDRVMVDGEPMSAGVYARIINSLKLDRVYIFDPHSDVTPSVINNCISINNIRFVSFVTALYDIHNGLRKSYIVCPDAGARKKTLKLFQSAGNNHDDILYCDKERNVRTGELTGFTVPRSIDLKDTTCTIVDDICDGGGTFLGLGKILRERGVSKLNLVVSHGIFSKGFKALNDMFDGIYTTDSIRNWNPNDIKYYYGVKPNLEVVNTENIVGWNKLFRSPTYTEHSIDA